MKAIPTYRRIKMVEAVEAGESVTEVAQRFEISETAIRKFLKLREEGSLAPKPPAGGPPSKLTDEDRERLLKAVDKQPDATLTELIEECELEVSESTLCRELQKLDRRPKRKVPRASEQNEAKVQRQRLEWTDRIAHVDPKRLVFLDEAGISTKMTKRYARAPRGVRVYTDVPYRHYKTLTVLGGMRLDGGNELPTLVYPGGTTTDRMVEYVTGPLSEVLRPGDIVVADNLAAHQANRVSAALAAQDVEIWLLPPYSPDFNPIERMWSKIKATLRAAKEKTIDRLRTAVDDALATVTNSDIYNWYAHSNYLEMA